MALFDIHVTVKPDPFVSAALLRMELMLTKILARQEQLMNDLTNLEATIAALEAKAAENNATLAGLAQAVIDLKNAGNQQEAIDLLTQRAQGVLDSISAAEDAADDQLPQGEQPTE